MKKWKDSKAALIIKSNSHVTHCCNYFWTDMSLSICVYLGRRFVSPRGFVNCLNKSSYKWKYVNVNYSVVEFIVYAVECFCFLISQKWISLVLKWCPIQTANTFAGVCTVVELAKKIADYTLNCGRRYWGRFESFHPRCSPVKDWGFQWKQLRLY